MKLKKIEYITIVSNSIEDKAFWKFYLEDCSSHYNSGWIDI